MLVKIHVLGLGFMNSSQFPLTNIWEAFLWNSLNILSAVQVLHPTLISCDVYIHHTNKTNPKERRHDHNQSTWLVPGVFSITFGLYNIYRFRANILPIKGTFSRCVVKIPYQIIYNATWLNNQTTLNIKDELDGKSNKIKSQPEWFQKKEKVKKVIRYSILMTHTWQ